MGSFSFSGMIGRQQFIISYLVTILLMVALFFGLVASEGSNQSLIAALASIGIIAVCIYSFQIIVQRMRDIGISQWFIIFVFIPYVNTAYIIYLMVVKGGSHNE